jgi:predicted Ser/Thr protein kinase
MAGGGNSPAPGQRAIGSGMDANLGQLGDPNRLGDYELQERLGSGGQGVVYLGHTRTGDLVAVKLLRAEISQDPPARNRFLQEAAAAKRVARFCTAQVLDMGIVSDRPYIVSEYVEGPSLQRAVTETGPRTGGALERLAVSTATALAAIHEAGIVHRDFKPGNVILGPDGPRVIDFGIARALDATTTTSPHLAGSPPYMAPEQISGLPIGPPADMFAWGTAMAFAANGAPPFRQASIPAMFNQILNAEPELGQLSGVLRELVEACLAKDPALRPTAHQVLRRLLSGGRAASSADTLVLAEAATAISLPEAASALLATGSGTAAHPADVVKRRPRLRSWRVLVPAAAVVGVVSVVIATALPQMLRQDLSWRHLTDLSPAVDSPGVAVLDDEIWVVGGLQAGDGSNGLGLASKEVQVYNPRTSQWREGPSLLLPIDHAAVASDGRTIYVVGGETDDGGKKVVQRSVYRLTENKQDWREVEGTPLPEPRAAGVAAWDGDRLVFAGGFATPEGPARGEVWALEDSGWKKIGDLKPPRQHLAAASDGKGRVWLLGGRDGRTLSRSVDLVTGDKVRPTTKITPVSAPAAVWHPDAGVCLLGGQRGGDATNTVLCPGQAAGSAAWPVLPVGRFGAGAAVLDNAVYLVGGITRTGTTGRVDVLELE